jgi:hypothetical protein
MENCSLALRIPSFDHDDSVAVDIAHIGSSSTIDVWALEVDGKVDLRRLSFDTLPRRTSKVGAFTPRYNATERLPDFRCDSGTYYAFLLACPPGAGMEDCRVDMTSTKEELIGESISRNLAVSFFPHISFFFFTLWCAPLLRQDFSWSSVRRSEGRKNGRREGHTINWFL